MTKLTGNQSAAISGTNKYGVVYGINPATARSLVTRGLLTGHTNFYGKTHGYKLTSAGWQAKREMKG